MLALGIVALWAFAEATVWFIVADVPIMAVALAGGVKRGVTAALVAGVFAMLGGLVTYAWAASDPVGSRAAMEALPGISPALFEEAAADYRSGGWQAMLAGSFAGVPYKLYAHAAGVTGSGIATFALASLVARLPRFLLIGAVAGVIGPRLRQRIGSRVVWALFALGWLAFYAWYFSAMASPGPQGAG